MLVTISLPLLVSEVPKILFQLDENLLNDVTNSPMVISLVHDLAECVVGDITPHDNVADADKHRMEVEAMESLVSRLAPNLAQLFKTAFNRFVH